MPSFICASVSGSVSASTSRIAGPFLRFHPREGQKALDDISDSAALPDDAHADISLLAFLAGLIHEDLRAADDAAHGVVDLVGHAGGEFAQRSKVRLALGLLFALPQRLLGLLSFGQSRLN
jgi:hypothetical protein